MARAAPSPGEVAEDEMFRAFNLGIGMIAACDGRYASEVMETLRAGGVGGSVVIGAVGEGEGVRYVCHGALTVPDNRGGRLIELTG